MLLVTGSTEQPETLIEFSVLSLNQSLQCSYILLETLPIYTVFIGTSYTHSAYTMFSFKVVLLTGYPGIKPHWDPMQNLEHIIL